MKKLLIGSLLIAGASQSMAVNISFDEFGVAPEFFNDTNPLRDEYLASQGVSFSAPGFYDGGAILSGDGIWTARSGTNFLAYNRAGTSDTEMQNGGQPHDPQRITFSDLQGSVSIWANSFKWAGLFVIAAYDNSNSLIGFNTFSTNTNEWTELSFTASSNIIRSVVLTEASGASAFAFDDLNAEAVPEPASMVALGLGAAALIRRRKKS